MPFYLLNEDGTKLALEDLSGFLILEEEEVIVGPTIDYGGGGGGEVTRRRRFRRQELYDAIDATIRRLLAGDEVDVVLPISGVESGPTLVYEPTPGFTEALQVLTRLAESDGRLLRSVGSLESAISDYESERQAREEDEEEELMFF